MRGTIVCKYMIPDGLLLNISHRTGYGFLGSGLSASFSFFSLLLLYRVEGNYYASYILFGWSGLGWFWGLTGFVVKQATAKAISSRFGSAFTPAFGRAEWAFAVGLDVQAERGC